jgi:hypothetical protein
MNTNEIKSLSDKIRNDGARLFGVSEFIYTYALKFGWLMGIIGGILSLIIIFQINFLAGIGIVLLTAIIEQSKSDRCMSHAVKRSFLSILVFQQATTVGK